MPVACGYTRGRLGVKKIIFLREITSRQTSLNGKGSKVLLLKDSKVVLPVTSSIKQCSIYMSLSFYFHKAGQNMQPAFVWYRKVTKQLN